MSREYLCRCIACGWTGLYRLDTTGIAALDGIRSIALAAGGHTPMNRCHECRTGEVVEARGERERADAVQAAVGRVLAADLNDEEVSVKVDPRLRLAAGDIPMLSVRARSYGRIACMDIDAFAVDLYPRPVLTDVAMDLRGELRRERTAEERAEARYPCPVCGDDMERNNRHQQRVRPQGPMRLAEAISDGDIALTKYTIACSVVTTCRRPSCIDRGGRVGQDDRCDCGRLLTDQRGICDCGRTIP